MASRPFLVRLLMPFTLMIVLVVTVCGSVVYFAGERAAYGGQLDALDRAAGLVRAWLSTADAGNPPIAPPSAPGNVSTTPPSADLSPDQRARVGDVARLLDARLTLIDGSGVVRFDSFAGTAAIENHNDRPEVRQARRDGFGTARRHSATAGHETVYLAQRLDPAEPLGWVIRLAYPTAFWAGPANPVWLIVLASVLAALLLVVVLARLLSRQWIGPTRALARGVERMSAGEWQFRVPPAGADELQAFSVKLNALAAQVQRQLAELRTQRGDLQALVDTLPDSIVVTDSKGRIVLINRPASRLLDVSPEQAIGTKLVAAVNDNAVLELFDAGARDDVPAAEPARPAVSPTPAADATPDAVGAADAAPPVPADPPTAQPVQRAVRLTRNGQRLTFQAFATRTAGGGVLLVLRDVSQLAANVQMKTDFVANASHELRTPIAAIKIAFETLREVYQEDADQTDRCVRIIEGHLRRLEEMLRDLLDLSRVESPDLKPQLQPAKTNEVHAFLRSALGPLARQKGVDLRLVDGPNTPAEFYTDERLLNLVLKNLVENSIKFTPAGGSVTIEIESGDDDVRVQVADTGIGIPAEHVDRVFERFYQVDPARSGSAGRGTGLGLAIVKHAVAGLGGAISLRSTVGGGTTVTFVLPQTPPTHDRDDLDLFANLPTNTGTAAMAGDGR